MWNRLLIFDICLWVRADLTSAVSTQSPMSLIKAAMSRQTKHQLIHTKETVLITHKKYLLIICLQFEPLNDRICLMHQRRNIFYYVQTADLNYYCRSSLCKIFSLRSLWADYLLSHRQTSWLFISLIELNRWNVLTPSVLHVWQLSFSLN